MPTAEAGTRKEGSVGDYPMHCVCTYEEAEAHIRTARSFWISPCVCRDGGPGCKRSRHEVCLGFVKEAVSQPSKARGISRADAEASFRYAKEKGLVPRPFRSAKDKNVTEGLCFCCDCCCTYLAGGDDDYDKGIFIEKTDVARCTHCGTCEPVCYFGARPMAGGELALDRDRCAGCGLCVPSCPEACIEMVDREP
jgi:Na+-translocating ferredoxin:NAD+ oxidoreductase subunit B